MSNLRVRDLMTGDVPLSVSREVSSAVKVREVMNWQVETIEADDDAATAAAIMRDNKYGCLPVLEQGVLAGILTEADFVRHIAEESVVPGGHIGPSKGKRSGR